MKTVSVRAFAPGRVFGFGNCRKTFRAALGTLALTSALALAGSPGHAACQGTPVWLYGDGGAYYASGYTVAGGHVSDPMGVQVGTLSGQDIYDSQNNLIGFVTPGE